MRSCCFACVYTCVCINVCACVHSLGILSLRVLAALLVFCTHVFIIVCACFALRSRSKLGRWCACSVRSSLRVRVACYIELSLTFNKLSLIGK